MSGFTPRLAAEYVLPLNWATTRDSAELTDYLSTLQRWLDVTVVDGSPSEVFAHHAQLWAPLHVRHLRPQPWPGRNGKVAGVVTGVFLARWEHVVIADDDVRWERDGLRLVLDRLADCDLARPQNVFVPRPWHARWDTSRSLLNRALGADYPGTYALRRSTFVRAGGYDGDVLFENLELSRTIRAVGGREEPMPSLFVARRPPSVRHFASQRVRQAYDDFAQPARLVLEAAVLPTTIVLLRRLLGHSAAARQNAWVRPVLAGFALPTLLAEIGRRRHDGRSIYPPTAALWAPLWVAERAVCVWIAIGRRLTGGTPYAGTKIVRAASSLRYLRRMHGVVTTDAVGSVIAR